ncbi:MAG: DNA double-strand break repair nuclease NurA, partial [Pyrinomonadaceae bacterium]
LIEELSRTRDDFVEFGRATRESARDYVARLRALEGKTAAEIGRAAGEGIAAGVARAPGALPTEEIGQAGSFVVPFGRAWRTHEEARAWAVDALSDRVTFAADGSQIMPGREVSLPVAAVQVAWFENPHTRDGASYRKEWDFKLVTPQELLETEGVAATAADLVGLRRVEQELAAVREFLKRREGWQQRRERTPVAFFDGTLLLSTTRLRGETLKFPNSYIAAISETVRLSRETRVPLVGYIDQSYARDVVRLLDVVARKRSEATIFDAQLFASGGDGDDAPLFARWGDRSVFCGCVREGLTAEFRDEAGEPLVGFIYLQTTAPGEAPARLDIPAWVAEEGLIEDVADAVRGECVVGNGYPYALETADEAAVITARDREQFLRAVQDFAEANALPFRVSRKLVSKIHRR